MFFLTPQVLTNDLNRSACPAESVKCLVVDEAHKATGNHAYCMVNILNTRTSIYLSIKMMIQTFGNLPSTQ